MEDGVIVNKSVAVKQDRWHRGVRPFNRHSLILVIAGTAYVLTGCTYIFADVTPGRKEALKVALHWFPIQFWGGIFIAVGMLSILSSRWPQISASWGYAVLTGFSAGWSATYLSGVIFENAPKANLTIVLQWALLAFLWAAIPGLVSPDKTVVVVVKGDDRRTD
jgi:hypothetical protein